MTLSTNLLNFHPMSDLLFISMNFLFQYQDCIWITVMIRCVNLAFVMLKLSLPFLLDVFFRGTQPTHLKVFVF